MYTAAQKTSVSRSCSSLFFIDWTKAFANGDDIWEVSMGHLSHALPGQRDDEPPHPRIDHRYDRTASSEERALSPVDWEHQEYDPAEERESIKEGIKARLDERLSEPDLPELPSNGFGRRGQELLTRGGLDLRKTNAAKLADCIFHQTWITNCAQDQPHSITTPGAIFQIPAEDSEPLIMESLTRLNPTITVLDARHIKDTGIVQVLFLGPYVPFWVRYRRLLSELTHSLHLTLHTDPSSPTRIGNSAQRDITPNVTFSTGQLTHHTSTTPHTLRSDHCIISTCFTLKGIYTNPLPPSTTNTHRLGSFRSECPLPPTATCDSDLKQWTTHLLSAKQIATKTIDPPSPAEYVDTHLRNLWEAYTSLEQRWRKHTHRRNLRLKLQTLRTKIKTHALTLARNNWNNTCDELRGQLSTKKVWHLLRALLDPRTTKIQSRHQTTQNITDIQLSPTALCDTLLVLHNTLATPNPQLDAPITFAKLHVAVQALKRNTTPGHDNITNTLLRHLNEEALEHLLNHTLPSTWKHSNITLIPKPVKPPSIHNLRLISLTSCLGKLLEHVRQNVSATERNGR
ncbi:hypothetical protein HPB47_027069, partial [Ixodes persulcatus]